MTYGRLAALADLPGVAGLATPVILLDEAAAEQNIARVVELVGADHWRPHVKTARTGWAIDRLRAAGVRRFKAATLAEVEALLDRGAEDVLLAYPAVGPVRSGLAALAGAHPSARVATLVDDPAAIGDWPRGVGAFVDVDTGMHRTGVDVADAPALAAALIARGVELRGLHAYDGHLADTAPDERRAEVTRRRADLDALGLRLGVGEVCLGSSHTFLETLAVPGSGPHVTVGVGTAVYNDARSLARYAAEAATSGFVAAAGVLSRVISRRAGQVTLDAGLAAIQVDAGRPHAVVAGRPGLTVGAASQEHLVVTGDVTGDVAGLGPGDRLVLLPRHLDTALTQVDRLYRVAADGTVTPEPVITPRRAAG